MSEFPESSKGNLVKRLLDFQGKAGRLEYFLISFGFWLIIIPIALFFDVAEGVIGLPDATLTTIWALISLPVYLILFVSVHIRRLHDLDQTGWFTLILLVPCANALLGFYLLFFPGRQTAP
jgi:uncharacterized membrane protein YhaH (DUF805 family)